MTRIRPFRYGLVDEVVSLDLGPRPRIEVRKTFAPGDDAFSGPAGPERLPNSLLVELLAVAGGRLVFRHSGGSLVPLLVRVRECCFEAPARAGIALRVVGGLTTLPSGGNAGNMAEFSGEVYAGTLRVARGRLLYARVSLPGVDPARLEALR